MANEKFNEILTGWVGSDVTIVNPESYKSTALMESLGFQAYTAKIAEVGEDNIKLSFGAQKKGKQVEVEQWIPIDSIKRISVMGGDKYIHL